MALQDADPSPSKSPVRVRLLLEEYKIRSSDIQAHSDRIHKLSTFSYTLLALVTGLLTIKFYPFSAPSSSSETLFELNTFYFVALFLLPVVSFYVTSSTLEAYWYISMNGLRQAAIERLLNAEAKMDVLCWAGRLTPEIYDLKPTRALWINPTFLSVFWGILLLFVVVGTLSFIAFRVLLFPYSLFYAIFLIVILGIHCSMARTFLNDIRLKMATKAAELSGIPDSETARFVSDATKGLSVFVRAGRKITPKAGAEFPSSEEVVAHARTAVMAIPGETDSAGPKISDWNVNGSPKITILHRNRSFEAGPTS